MSDLAIISTHFNPCGYQSRQENLHRFLADIRAQKVPFLLAELAIGNADFTLPESSDIVRFRAKDILWHKERLLNQLIRLLPAEYTKVAWVDADVIFPHTDWYNAASQLLESYKLIQLFDNATQSDSSGRPRRTMVGVASYADRGGIAPFQFDASGTWPGLAWAARRDLLNEIRFFDPLVVGGADTYMCLAAYGPIDASYDWHVQRLSPALQTQYLSWAHRLHSEVNGRVGYLPITIVQLGHGPEARRRYVDRLNILSRHDFDPALDLAPNAQGLWAWASGKIAMQEEVAAYFAGRREDDSPSPFEGALEAGRRVLRMARRVRHVF